MMNITTCKKNAKSTKHSHLSNEKLFNEAWQRVTNQQNKNDRLRNKIKTFAQHVTESIKDQEKAHIATLYKNCEKLLVFYSRKSLAEPQHELLMEWILNHLDTLTNNPFADGIDLAPLNQALESSLIMRFRMFDACQDDDDDDYDDDDNSYIEAEKIVEDLFSYIEPDLEYYEFLNQQEAFEQQIKDDEKNLNKLMKSTSIKKLFRQIAGVIHPDREQNEEASQEKNHQMSELIKARDSNDIITLFSFYTQYIGKSPLEGLGGDVADATQLLNRQFQKLRSQYTEILHENSKENLLYQRFHKKTTKASELEINKHITHIAQRIDSLEFFNKEVTNLSQLKSYIKKYLEHES